MDPTVKFTVAPQDSDYMAQRCLDLVREHKAEAETQMAEAVYAVVMANFGAAGPDRPWPWELLRPSYAKKVGRDYATLYVTGRMASAVKVLESSGQGAFVELSNADCQYALAHHYGSPSTFLVARRVFPVYSNDEVTDFTKKAALEAAQAVFDRALGGGG